jgi:hypothetical protein
MSRRFALLLLPLGPLCVAFLRFLLPYYSAPDNLASARAVLAHPGREGVVLWLALAAILTLVPGVVLSAELLPDTRLRSIALSLVVAGYLCLPALVTSDVILWTGAHLRMDPHQTARILDGLHPSMGVALAIFIVGHVLGTVLLGVAFLRSGRIPPLVSWAMIVSQPLHFVTTVFLHLAWVDLLAWTLTAAAMGVVAVKLLDRHVNPSPEPVRVEIR